LQEAFMSGPVLTRRERQRQETISEIKQLAREQVSAGGAAAVSLNAIARAMAMSPGALYRYYGSRDDLLAALAVDAYGSLADELERAAGEAGSAAERLARIAGAYRDWAIERPNTYRLIFETSAGSGRDLARDEIVPAASRSMDVVLAVLAQLGPLTQPIPLPAGLGDEISAWGRRTRYPELPVSVLHLALAFWARLHGLVSLDIGHHLEATGVSAGLLIEAEITALLRMFDAAPSGHLRSG
jgi:AcrR family transcriptional regulator